MDEIPTPGIINAAIKQLRYAKRQPVEIILSNFLPLGEGKERIDAVEIDGKLYCSKDVHDLLLTNLNNANTGQQDQAANPGNR